MGDPHNIEVFSYISRLLIALVLAAVFGLERERRNRAAGLRTHLLVTLGATLITLVSESYGRGSGQFPAADPTRITAQIVSGIGFLGAGTIIVRGGTVRGLTTAASLWVAAALGIAVGRGGEFLIVAAVTSLLVLFVLTVLDRLEDVLIKKRPWRQVTIGYTVGAGSDSEIASLFNEMNIRLRSIEREESSDPGLHITEFLIQLPPGLEASRVDARLLTLPGVRRIEWE
ncbi:MAG: MgtC/SapB family protein [Armatimonadetes bacterium]|nr:MgtC/SapB family protein [Armatimonadota bacterium]